MTDRGVRLRDLDKSREYRLVYTGRRWETRGLEAGDVASVPRPERTDGVGAPATAPPAGRPRHAAPAAAPNPRPHSATRPSPGPPGSL